MAVAAVKLFKIEEQKESQPAMTSQGRRPQALGPKECADIRFFM